MEIEETLVDLNISGKLSYSDKISVAMAAQIVALVNSSPTAGAQGTNLPPVLSTSKGSNPSITTSNPRHALELSGAKKNSEKLVALALHAMQQGGKTTFTLGDVKPLFRQARERAPGNLSRDLDTAIRAGWIAEAEMKGEYFVIDRASRVLETGFEDIRGGRGNGAKSRASSTKRPRKVNTEIPASFVDLEFSPVIDGYPKYHELTVKMDKLLWAVNAANLQGVSGVTNQDMVWLTDNLGDGISGGDIGTHYRNNFKKGFLNRSIRDQSMRITPPGTAHLKSLKGDES
jgi:hypothetical protein